MGKRGIALPVVMTILSLGAFGVYLSQDLDFVRPRVLCENGSQYCWGTVDEGGLVDHEFVLRNVGLQPLHIDRLVKDCGCLRATLDRNVIKRGDAAVVRVRYEGRGGRVTDFVKVSAVTNDSQRPVVPLALFGEVKRSIEVIPTTVVLHEPRAPVKVEFRSCDPLSAIDVGVPGEWVRVTQSVGQSSLEYSVELADGCPDRNFTGTIHFRVMVGDRLGTVDVPVHILRPAK